MKYAKGIEILQDTARILKDKMIGESNRIEHSKLEDAYFEIRARIKDLVKKGERK